jgi:hypothetical protein
MNLKPTHGEYLPMNIQERSYLANAEHVRFQLFRKAGCTATLWLDLRIAFCLTAEAFT